MAASFNALTDHWECYKLVRNVLQWKCTLTGCMLMFSEHSIGALKHSTNSCFTQTSSSVSNTCKTVLLASYWYIYLLHRPLHVQHTHLRSISWFVFNKIKFKALHTKMLNIIVILLRLHKSFHFCHSSCAFTLYSKRKKKVWLLTQMTSSHVS